MDKDRRTPEMLDDLAARTRNLAEAQALAAAADRLRGGFNSSRIGTSLPFLRN